MPKEPSGVASHAAPLWLRIALGCTGLGAVASILLQQDRITLALFLISGVLILVVSAYAKRP
jgi:hypothetical protein